MIEEKGNKWKGKDLIAKIQWASFLVLYMAFPFILSLLRPVDETGYIPMENILTFTIILIIIVFYVIIMGWTTEHYMRLKEREFAGKRVPVGTIDTGSGRGQDFEFVIKRMWRYETLSENLREGIERSHETMLDYENKRLEELEDKSGDMS